MSYSVEEQIVDLEEKLKRAMLQSDVTMLDELIAPELIFTTHLGHVFSKQDDLSAHESGMIRIDELETSEQVIQRSGEVVIVSVRAMIKGVFSGQPAAADLRFTRIWSPTTDGGWHIIAGHSSVVV